VARGGGVISGGTGKGGKLRGGGEGKPLGKPQGRA